MTTGVAISIILLSAFKIVVTCLPTGVVNWLLTKFATHKKLSEDTTKIIQEDKVLNGDKKTEFIKSYNEAIYLMRYYIFPGNEESFLNPNNGVIPITIKTKEGKKEVIIFVFRYKDRIDIVKQKKRKVISYQLQSDILQL